MHFFHLCTESAQLGHAGCGGSRAWKQPPSLKPGSLTNHGHCAINTGGPKAPCGGLESMDLCQRSQGRRTMPGHSDMGPIPGLPEKCRTDFAGVELSACIHLGPQNPCDLGGNLKGIGFP